MLNRAPLPLQAICGDSRILAWKKLEKNTDSLGTPPPDPLGSVWKEQRTPHAHSKAEGLLLPSFQSHPMQELHFPGGNELDPGWISSARASRGS